MASDHKNEPVPDIVKAAQRKTNRVLNGIIIFLAVAIIIILLVANKNTKQVVTKASNKSQSVQVKIDTIKDTITYPHYVYNKLIKKWAVITGKDKGDHHNKWDIFFGSHDLYDKEIEKRIPQQIGSVSLNMNWIFSGGKWVTVLDSAEDVGLGGEFQFPSKDSAMIEYNKYHQRMIRKKEIDDSLERRTQFVNDSTFNHNHTYQ